MNNTDCVRHIFLLDFDGTITGRDVCDLILQEHSSVWEKIGKLHDEGDISHLEMNRRFLQSISASPKELNKTLNNHTFLRSGVVDFLNELMLNNQTVIIVSGGWNFYIEHILRNEGGFKAINLIDSSEQARPGTLNIYANQVLYENKTWTLIESKERSFLCTPNKLSLIRSARANDNFSNVIYFGNGSTDFDAVFEVDMLFALDKLQQHADAHGLSFYPIKGFKKISFDEILLKYRGKQKDGILSHLRQNYFFDPYGKNHSQLSEKFKRTILEATSQQGNGPLFGKSASNVKLATIIDNATISDDLVFNPFKLLGREIADGLQTGVKAGHPMMVKNIIPVPSTIYLISHLIASIYSQNGVTGEDAGFAALAEVKAAASLAEIAGYDKKSAGGVFTFGGTATNMYAIKVGLSKCYPNSNISGFKDVAQVLGSRPAHYSHITATDWLGIGQKNYIYAKSNQDQSTDLEDLRRLAQQIVNSGKKIACIIGLGGSTSNMAIDDFSQIRQIRDDLVKKFSLEYVPHIHADSVVGWPYLFFKGYDFNENELGLSELALNNIKLASARISTLSSADSFGVDFHKTGYMPYVSSMFIANTAKDLESLGRDSDLMTPLFHDETKYNPGKITLETSRSSATMLSAWLTLQSFGKNGYRALLGNAQEMALFTQYLLDATPSTGLFVVNRQGYGSDVFVGCFSPGTDCKNEFSKQLKDPNSLKVGSQYTSEFFNWLSKNNSPFLEKFSISKTSAAFYTEYGEPYVALRLYFLSPYTTKDSIYELVEELQKAKHSFDTKEAE